jgi:MerR family transcriptional regulator/heat shock protein HspR
MRIEHKKTIGFVSLINNAESNANGTANGTSNGAGVSANPKRRNGDRTRPVYHISVVAEIVETHPQTLRMYERMGLISPQRTRNNIRLYSEADVEQVRRIQHLTQDLGVNLAGVEVVFKLLQEMERLRQDAEQQNAELETFRQEMEQRTGRNGNSQNGAV